MASGFLANFNNSAEYSFYYKLTSEELYYTEFKLFQPSLTSYKANLFINNNLVFNDTLTSPFTAFYNTLLSSTTPAVCSFYLQLSTSQNVFLTAFSLSAKIIPSFITADFIGFPGSYFTTPAGTLKTLTFNDYIQSPGMFFYGEGHTDTIYLSAINVSPQAINYIWKINNSTTQYPLSTSSLQPRTSAAVRLSSTIGTDLRLPVSLQVFNNTFLSTDPLYYRDDITGQAVYYPYFSTTVDLFGNELLTNNNYHQSIRVLPYNNIQYVFNPGIGSIIYLPINGSQVPYLASLQTAVEGTGLLSACYDKYGFIWQWSQFEDCTNIPQTFVNKASSWATVECSGTFPKIWRNLTPAEIAQGLLSAADFSSNPITCSATRILWTLDTINWSESISAAEGETTLPYFLSLDNFGLDDYTASYFADTNITLSAEQSLTCRISANLNQAPGYTNDWLPRDFKINLSHNILSIAPPDIKIYTSNRFVLTGSNVRFENLITNRELLSVIEVNFDDNKVFYYTGSDINLSHFSTTYDIPGYKTVTIKVYTNYDATPIVFTCKDIIQVLPSYDDVFPEEYRSSNTPIQLPWPNKPQIGANDWVTEDNINSNIKKLYDNLRYLESRGNLYQGIIPEFFGHLSVLPRTTTSGLSVCRSWTWEDTDCFIPTTPEPVTWRDVLSAESFLDTGRYANCGTWQIQECVERATNPTCFGLYDKRWQWGALKQANSLELITWRDTVSADGVFKKTWLYEPSTNIVTTIVPCDAGIWSVNIPKLDTFYDPIPNPFVQSKCIYNGIASRNNVLFLAQKTQLKLLSSDYLATYFTNRESLDDVVSFVDLKNICLDSEGKIYTLDGTLNQVVVYTYEPGTPGNDWRLFIQWGGFGTAGSTTRFSRPNDIHIDQFDNIWVCDTGNGCVKLYTNTGTWLRTIIDDQLKQATPLSLCVDSQRNVHILTQENIKVYTYTGEFLFEYNFKEYVSTLPRKINTSYNREVIYLACESQVIKFFRNGIFFSYIIQQKQNVNNITAIYHDEFRNLLITTDDKILKYPDKMTLVRIKGNIPNSYWSLQDLYIHEEEYVQNWVYTKSLQRVWDNIEIFRNTLFYQQNFCKGFRPPVHTKDKILIGQNEIVTSTVVNRIFNYLWDNFNTLLDYFNPNCQEPFNP
jgi:hypothetical protein